MQDELCARLEALAQSNDDEATVRRGLRELLAEWKQGSGFGTAAARARDAVPQRPHRGRHRAGAARTGTRERGVADARGQEAVCEEESAERGRDDGRRGARERWAALPALPDAWEKRMQARRDAAVRRGRTPRPPPPRRGRIDAGTQRRRDDLLLLETALGLESPPEFAAQRLALQVRQLKERFSGGATMAPETLNDRVLAWFATPGVTDEGDRQRCDAVLAALAKRR